MAETQAKKSKINPSRTSDMRIMSYHISKVYHIDAYYVLWNFLLKMVKHFWFIDSSKSGMERKEELLFFFNKKGAEHATGPYPYNNLLYLCCVHSQLSERSLRMMIKTASFLENHTKKTNSVIKFEIFSNQTCIYPWNEGFCGHPETPEKSDFIVGDNA